MQFVWLAVLLCCVVGCSESQSPSATNPTSQPVQDSNPPPVLGIYALETIDGKRLPLPAKAIDPAANLISGRLRLDGVADYVVTMHYEMPDGKNPDQSVITHKSSKGSCFYHTSDSKWHFTSKRTGRDNLGDLSDGVFTIDATAADGIQHIYVHRWQKP